MVKQRLSRDGALDPHTKSQVRTNREDLTRKEQVGMGLGFEAPSFVPNSYRFFYGSADSNWQQSIAAVRDRHSPIGAVGRGLADAPIGRSTLRVRK